MEGNLLRHQLKIKQLLIIWDNIIVTEIVCCVFSNCFENGHKK